MVAIPKTVASGVGLPAEPFAEVLICSEDSATRESLSAMPADVRTRAVAPSAATELRGELGSRDFAAIVIDLVPDPDAGLAAARRVRSEPRSRRTPILFAADPSLDDDRRAAAFDLGAVDIVTTPISRIEFRSKIQWFVEQFQEKIRSSHEREQLHLLVHGTSDHAIFMLDPDGYVLTWNPGAERMKGYTAAEIVGRHFSRFYPPEMVERGWPRHELAVAEAEGRFEDEGWRVRKDGTRFWANVVITALRDEQGRARGFSKVMRDLTDRKAAEESSRRLAVEAAARRVAQEQARVVQKQREALRESEARFRGFLEQAPFSVQVFSADGRTVGVNKAWEELWGVSFEELRDYVVLDDPQLEAKGVTAYLRRAFAGDSVAIPVIEFDPNRVLVDRDPPADKRWVSAVAYPLKDEEGRVREVVLVHEDVSDRRLAEEERRIGETRTRRILESIADAFFAVGRDWRLTYVNPQAERLFEPEAQSPLGRLIWEVLPGFLDTPFERAFRRAADERATQSVTAAYLEPDRWFEARVYPGHEGISIYLQDVSERKRAEAEVARLTYASEQQRRIYEAALSNPLDAVYVFDLTGRFAFANEALVRLLGRPREEILGRRHDELGFPADLADRFRRQILHVVRTRGPVEDRYSLPAAGGERHHEYIFMPVIGDQGTAEAVVGLTRDVTDRRRREDAAHFLAEASAALSVVVDQESTMQTIVNLAVPFFADWSGVDLLNQDGSLRRLAVAHQQPDKLVLANRLMREYPPDPKLPFGPPAVLRTGVPEIVSEISDDLYVRAAKDERHLHLLRELNLRSYLSVPLQASGATFGVLTFAMADSGRTYTQADLALARDLAQRAAVAIENTRLYEALRDADRRKDEFLATLAHELRNPLAPIRNSLQILKIPRVDAEVVGRARDMMERQVHQLVRLVDDLLDVSRVMRGRIDLRREVVELSSIVARAVETAQPLIESQGHDLTVRLDDEPLMLDADPVRLAQVVGNLLTNAAKYTEPHGKILLTARREGDFAVLSVLDDGIGIAPEMIGRIFDLFVQVDHAATRSQGGLGVGLTLIKNLVELHGGTVEARSEGLGRGCEFIVRLPLLVGSANPVDPNVPETRTEPAPRGGSRLLVVDDNRDAASSLSMLLKLQGHEVRVAHSGQTALAMAESYRPDMVFLDIGMPGMDGYEVARRLRRTPGLERTVLAALTGWGQQEDRRRTADAGFDHHLVKPPEPKVLENLLADLTRPHDEGR